MKQGNFAAFLHLLSSFPLALLPSCPGKQGWPWASATTALLHRLPDGNGCELHLLRTVKTQSGEAMKTTASGISGDVEQGKRHDRTPKKLLLKMLLFPRWTANLRTHDSVWKSLNDP